MQRKAIFCNQQCRMRKGFMRLSLTASLLLPYLISHAQTTSSDGSSNSFLMILLATVVLIAFFVIIQVSDNLLRLEAKKAGMDDSNDQFSIFPSLRNFFSPKRPAYVRGNFVKLDRGHNLNLLGEAALTVDEGVQVNTYALQPGNFRGISPIPKLLVEVGSNVKAGDPLFFDKSNPDMNFVAPVSGEVIAINRGERRAISEVVILADKKTEYRELPSFDLGNSSREDLVKFLLVAGFWPSIRQRPYDVVASTSDAPDNIFISTFDTAPTAPNLDFVVAGKGEAFQKGIDVLNRLTKGKVFLGLNANGPNAPSPVFTEAKGVEKYWFQGMHPAGNVGVQIHHIAPITAKSHVWTLGVQDVLTLGALFTEKRYNAERLVALTGAEISAPTYAKTFVGANISDLLKGKLVGDNLRIISGDVLSGQQKAASSFLNFHDDQISVIAEGNHYEMFGWLLPDLSSPSVSKALPGSGFSDTPFRVDTNTKGEKRAFVVTGQYEDVLPMDVYPQHIMKAVLTNDYEKMEGLGIHELIEEDVALCEFACTSKQPLQQILRKGLDMMHEQG